MGAVPRGPHQSPSGSFGTSCGISLGKAKPMESCRQEKSCPRFDLRVRAEGSDAGRLPVLGYPRGARLTP